MIKLLSKRKVKAIAAVIFFAAFIFPALYAAADENAEEIKEKASSLEQCLSKINKDLLAISDEIAMAQMQIEITNSEIQRTEDSLKAAKNDETQKYAAMKTRIKYMYETGGTSMLELLFSAKSMADFINKADFLSSVTDYDRNMLGKLQKVSNNIADKNFILMGQLSSLADLNNQLKEKQKDLTNAADAAREDLNEYYAKLEEIRKKEAEEAARRAAEEAKKREEEARRAAEEAKRREEAARRAAEEAKKHGENNGGASHTGSGCTIDRSHAPMEAADENEVRLFAAILQCEATSEYEPMLAVATVILNRVESPRFADTITDVVYAPGQFEPVWSGRLGRVIDNGPTNLAFTVARDALNGARIMEVADCYYFLYAGSTKRAGVNIGDNLFFSVW